MWTSLHARLHTTLRQRSLLTKNSRLLVAVSGGQDSLCLLKLLFDLQSKWQWELAVAHCDHCWSSDAGIADHVQQIARQWQLPFYLKTASQLKETEAAAREWRYQALQEIAQEQGFKIIVAGHTQSDRAETFLYNLIRGSGSDGISALTWQRFLTSDLQLIRPMLNVSRTETLQFCQQFQLPIWEDRVNKNLRYARNRIRIHLLPYLQTQFNPHVEQHLAQTAELLRADVECLEAMAVKLLEEIVTPERSQINRIGLRAIPLALQRRVIRHFLQNFLQKSPNFAEIEAVIYLIQAPNRTRTSSLSGNITAEVQGDWIIFTCSSSDARLGLENN